jgi:hypothetical protein
MGGGTPLTGNTTKSTSDSGTVNLSMSSPAMAEG